MTPTECTYALNVSRCTAPSYCQEAGLFLRQIGNLAKQCPEFPLMACQVTWLGRVYWQYREQLFLHGIQVVYGGHWPVLERDGQHIPVTRVAKGPDTQWNIHYWAASDGQPAFDIELVEFAFCQAAGVEEVTVDELNGWTEETLH
jgi:hypothetical protein